MPPAARLASVVAFLTLSAPATAQVAHGGAPVHPRGLSGDPPSLVLPEPDRPEPDPEGGRAPGGPARYGWVRPVQLGTSSSGLWEEIESGDLVWRQRVVSPGALSLGLVFSRYSLPPGATLFIYDDERASIRGAYTDANGDPSGGFAVQPIAGDALTLEYREPRRAAFAGVIELREVVHDYLGIVAPEIQDPGDRPRGSCYVDVVCPDADPWRRQVRSTVEILRGGGVCTGVMLNNTNQNGARLLLTAAHCGDLGNAIFRLNYERSDCGGGSATDTQTVQGSSLLAVSTGLDVRLVLLTEPIPPSYGVYLAGWDRTDVPPPSVATLHHPGGRPKMISVDLGGPRKSQTQWLVRSWETGFTEPGSSGAPLLSPEGHVVGVLNGSASTCAAPFDDFFARTAPAWPLLAPFLDPRGTAQPTLDGYDPRTSNRRPEITGFEPPQVEALVPGTEQTVTILGAYFTPGTQVLVDGAPLAKGSTFLGSTRISFDMPEADSLGEHEVRVESSRGSAAGGIVVVAPAAPRLQAGTGDAGNVVSVADGLDLLLGGEPGSRHVLFGSLSADPSVLPGRISLGLGGGFSELVNAGQYTIGLAGLTAVHLDLPSIAGPLFLQSLELDFPWPLAESNLQEIEVVP